MIIFSCASSDETKTVIKGEVLNIPIDATISPRTVVIKSANFGEGDLLYYLNEFNHEIIVFDINSKSVKNRIKFKKEGPNAIPFLGGFTILSENEILIADGPPKLYLVNLLGKIVKKIDYTLDDGQINYAHWAKTISVLSNDVYKMDGYFIIPQQPTFINSKKEKLGQNQKSQIKLFIKIKEDGTKPEFLNITIPNNFFDGKPFSNNNITSFSSLNLNGRLMWAFNNDMSIYYSNDLENVNKKEVDINKKPPKLNFNQEGLNPFERRMRLDDYKSFLHDPYRKQFYRMVRYGVEGDGREGLPAEHLARYPNKFSIFVFDEALNFKREVKFSGTKYHFNQFFICSKGFYLSLANPLNPHFDENYLQFEKIEL